MYEHEGVLIQRFENGDVMQVKLAPDKIDVRIRRVSGVHANGTTSDNPEWVTAYDFVMNEWLAGDSVVWQWLKTKGIDEIGMRKRLSGMV